MFQSVGRGLLVVLLCGALGLQWFTLQSIAWTMMLARNAAHSSLCEAVARTFDGEHPCALCHAVQQGKQSEKKSDLHSGGVRVDLFLTPRASSLTQEFQRVDYSEETFLPLSRLDSPPAPPPRATVS